MRYFAYVKPTLNYTGHYIIDSASAPAHKEVLGTPVILIIEKGSEKDNGYFLLTYEETGAFVGDSWHPNLEEAKEQAEFEYGDRVGTWTDIPEPASDAVAYVLEIMKKSRDKRKI